MNNNLNNKSIVLLKSCCILNYIKVKSPEYHAHLRYKNFTKTLELEPMTFYK